MFERHITLQADEASASPVNVTVMTQPSGRFNIVVRTASGETRFSDVSARLLLPNAIASSLSSSLETTIVAQPPSPAVPASTSTTTMERFHIFNKGQKVTLARTSPAWLLSLGSDVLNATKGALRAPMPCLIVEVKFAVGDRVEKGQAVVILESMKTETVLRAESPGVVKAVGCKKGEMVEEGRELVDIEPDEVEE